MNSPSLYPKSLKIASILFAAPILFAFLIGSLPVLIPVLLFRWLAQPTKPVSFEVPLPAIAQPA